MERCSIVLERCSIYVKMWDGPENTQQPTTRRIALAGSHYRSVDRASGRQREDGLTFRALSERLATGAGAIYWHIPNKSELLAAACDAIVARAMSAPLSGATPEESIRAVALGMFDAIDAHPWVGSALTHAAAHLPMVRILERIGQQVRALGVPDREQWSAVGTLLNYIFGVGGQNAANGQLARARGLDRSDFLETVATA